MGTNHHATTVTTVIPNSRGLRVRDLLFVRLSEVTAAVKAVVAGLKTGHYI
jgi:hypothetical protein